MGDISYYNGGFFSTETTDCLKNISIFGSMVVLLILIIIISSITINIIIDNNNKFYEKYKSVHTINVLCLVFGLFGLAGISYIKVT
jgi:hypothetical protein